jgi:spermidine synthase
MLALPTLFMGTTFPLLLRRVATTPRSPATSRLTVVNTAGTILGSIATGYVILPALRIPDDARRRRRRVRAARARRRASGAGHGYRRGHLNAPRPKWATSPRARRRSSRASARFFALVGLSWDLSRMTNRRERVLHLRPPPDAIEFVARTSTAT